MQHYAALIPFINVLAVYAPQTGDTNLNWLIPAAIVSAALIIVLIITGRRRR